MFFFGGLEEETSVDSTVHIKACGYVVMFKDIQCCHGDGYTDGLKVRAIEEHNKNLFWVGVCVNNH